MTELKNITAEYLRKISEENQNAKFKELLQELNAIAYRGDRKCSSYTINRFSDEEVKDLRERGFVIDSNGTISW